jgi:Pregnancy-associated plasma protein-A
MKTATLVTQKRKKIMNWKTSIGLGTLALAGTVLVAVMVPSPALARIDCDLNPNAPICGGGEEPPPPKPPKPPQTPPPVASIDNQICVTQPVSGQLSPIEQQSSLKIRPDGSVVGELRQPLSGSPALMWAPGQTLRVKISGAGATERVRAKIREFANVWTQHANINFDFDDTAQTPEIRINVEKYVAPKPGEKDKKGPSWSKVGRDALADNQSITMNFGWFNDQTTDREFRRVTLHEFGHALGLTHEHQSPAAGIQWDKDKTYQYFMETNGWDKANVDRDVFAVSATNSTNYSQFDSTSIMAYFIPANLTLNNQGIPGNTELSAVDMDFIRRWYPVEPDATGTLGTRDCGDSVQFTVQNRIVDRNEITFVLQPGPNITWWKSIKIPIKGGTFEEIEISDGGSAARVINLERIDAARPVILSKAKYFFRSHEEIRNWRVLPAISGGSKVTLTWNKDDGCAFGEGVIFPSDW